MAKSFVDYVIYKVRSFVGSNIKKMRRHVRRYFKGNLVLTYKDQDVTEHATLQEIMDSLGFDARPSLLGAVHRQFHHRGPRGMQSFIVSFPSRQMVDRPPIEYKVFATPINAYVGANVFETRYAKDVKIPKLEPLPLKIRPRPPPIRGIVCKLD